MEASNMAAMREALEGVRKDLWELMGSSSYSRREIKACEMSRRIRAALSAPPRNCDCHNDADSAYIAFCGYDFAAKDISDDAFIDWLFAPAAERKGESDGK